MVLNFTCLALSMALGAAPQAVTRAPVKNVAIDSTLLTTDALTKMTTFWSAFVKEPADVSTTGRKQNHEPLVLTLDIGSAGKEPANLPGVVNMVAMAAKFPSIAADLKQAGLTAQQWEDYRKALFEATLSSERAKANNATPTPTSVIGKNVAFLGTHQKEFEALKATGMWFPKLVAMPQASSAGSNGGDDLSP